MSEVIYKMLIDGELIDSSERLDVINPSTASAFTSVPDCSPEQLNIAVAAGRASFNAWKQTPLNQRQQLLRDAAKILRDNVENLHRLLSTEQGKSLTEARFEVLGASGWLDAVSSIEIPEEVNVDNEERVSVTRHEPLGLVAGISPWNFPVLLSFWKIAPALAAGNCIILKPSPFTPVTMLAIAELLQETFPAGVLNIITGGDELGPMVTQHPGIQKISFTGSTDTGKRVMRSASDHLTRITLELGGNDAAIVLPGADIDSVAKSLAWGAFRNSGQVCINAKRIYVHRDQYEKFSQIFVEEAASYKVGDPLEGSDLGPVQNARQYYRVLDLLDDCLENNYQILTGGDVDRSAAGYFIAPTVIDNPPRNSRVVCEEPFGPIVPLLCYDDIDTAVSEINQSEFGLAGSVWGDDMELAQAVATQLETGTVWINEIHAVNPFEAFSGHKQSGFGVENGLYGLMEYTWPKTITVNRCYTAQR